MRSAASRLKIGIKQQLDDDWRSLARQLLKPKPMRHPTQPEYGMPTIESLPKLGARKFA